MRSCVCDVLVFVFFQQEGLANRLANLASFQQRAVLKALSFPSVTDVVYSTCSIHAEVLTPATCQNSIAILYHCLIVCSC